MAILGIERVIYCVEDMQRSTDYFEDFGLNLVERSDTKALFNMPDTSKVIIQPIGSDPIPGSKIVGTGVHETTWGVDSEEDLERLVAKVSADREVRRDSDGSVHFIADGGIPMALRLWPLFRMPRTSVDPSNSPGNINRLNVHRKWIDRARPKRMMHVVYFVEDPKACAAFMRERLEFRLTDVQQGAGYYLKTDGTTDHHNVFFCATSALPPQMQKGPTMFSHVAYVVTDLDEVMVGRNYMTRRGWSKSGMGLGRHRIGSALFHYSPCPAGGEAEYSADGDQLDDNWLPRVWDISFGLAHWIHDMPDFWVEGHNWGVGFEPEYVNSQGSIKPRPYLANDKPRE